jgi:hypothetical protein
MSKQAYYEEIKDALGGDFIYGDVGEVMVEIADKLSSDLEAMTIERDQLLAKMEVA